MCPQLFASVFAFTGIYFPGMSHHVCDVAYDENMCWPIRTRKFRSTNWLTKWHHGTSQSCGVAYFGNLNFSVNKRVGDKNGRILILDANIDEIRYVLVNIYSANTEVEQVQVLSKLSELMKNINFSEENCIVLAGDPNVFFHSKLETKGGKPSLKKSL